MSVLKELLANRGARWLVHPPGRYYNRGWSSFVYPRKRSTPEPTPPACNPTLAGRWVNGHSDRWPPASLTLDSGALIAVRCALSACDGL
jgi:hypothetical protein